MVLNESSEALGNRSGIVRIWYLPCQQLMMERAEVILSEKLLLVFRYFSNKMVFFWFVKSKAISFSFQDYFDRSICNFWRLAGQKPYQFEVQVSLSRLCSMEALGPIQRDRFQANITE